MLAKGRTPYEAAIRAIGWGHGPIYAWASTSYLAAAHAVRYAFEDLLGWPASVHDASAGKPPTAPQAGSVVVLLTNGLPESAELASSLTKGGVQVLRISAGAPLPASAVWPAGRGIILPAAEDLPSEGPGEACLEHAGVGFMSFVAARLLKPPSRSLERAEKDWRELPDRFERMVDQAGSAVRSLAERLQAAPEVIFAGAGPYHAVALGAAELRERQGGRARALDLSGMSSESLNGLSSDSPLVLISSSRRTAHAGIGDLAAQLQPRGASVLAITDGNDRALIRRARLALLVPAGGEAASSVLAFGLAGWAACEGSLPRVSRHAPSTTPGRSA